MSVVGGALVLLEVAVVAYFLGLRIPCLGMCTRSTCTLIWRSPFETTPLGCLEEGLGRRLEEGLGRVREEVRNLREVVDEAIPAGGRPVRGSRAPGKWKGRT